jgi:heptaprenylglyceryl phosphate synthase
VPQIPGVADHAAKRPQPVLDAATVASAFTAIVGLTLAVLVGGGVIGQDDADNIAEAAAPAITALVGAASTIAAALKARRKVTPLVSPRNDYGEPLTTLHR